MSIGRAHVGVAPGRTTVRFPCETHNGVEFYATRVLVSTLCG